QLVPEGLEEFVFQPATALGLDARAPLAVEQRSELLYRLIHKLPTIARVLPRGYPGYAPVGWWKSQCCQHAVTDDPTAPAFQHGDVLTPVGELLQVPAGRQDLRAQSQVGGDGLVEGREFFHERGLQGIRPQP